MQLPFILCSLTFPNIGATVMWLMVFLNSRKSSWVSASGCGETFEILQILKVLVFLDLYSM